MMLLVSPEPGLKGMIIYFVIKAELILSLAACFVFFHELKYFGSVRRLRYWRLHKLTPSLLE